MPRNNVFAPLHAALFTVAEALGVLSAVAVPASETQTRKQPPVAGIASQP